MTKLKAWTNEEKHRLFPTQREANAFVEERKFRQIGRIS